MNHLLASIELLDEAALDTLALARACQRDADWVQTRVTEGIFSPDDGTQPLQWRFSCTTVVRARRVAQLEHMFDADPQLAAMTVDLMEEVLELRRRLEHR
ncbi:hypothetical protein GCM10027082_25480 [Comamonas humi]